MGCGGCRHVGRGLCQGHPRSSCPARTDGTGTRSVRAWRKSFATVLKDTNVTDEIQSIRFLGDDHAIAVSKAGILFPGESRGASKTGTSTRPGSSSDATATWLVESYHNSPVAQG